MILFLVGCLVGVCVAITILSLILIGGEEDEHEKRTRK